MEVKLDQLAGIVTEQFALEADSMKKICNVRDSTMKQRVYDLRASVDLFADLQGDEWKGIRSNYKSVIDAVMAEITLLINASRRRAEETFAKGFTNGCLDAEYVSSVSNVEWFDEFGSPGACSVIDSLHSMKSIYRQRIDLISTSLNSHLTDLLQDTNNSSSSINQLRTWLLPELSQIIAFDDELTAWEGHVVSQLLEYAGKIEKRGNDDLVIWQKVSKEWKKQLDTNECGGMTTELHGSLCNAGRQIEIRFGEIKDVMSLHSKCKEKLHHSYNLILGTVSHFADQLGSVMEVKGRYRAKEFSLAAAETLASHQVTCIYDFTELKRKALVAVENHAAELQKLSSKEPVDWKGLNSQINLFENATVIDRFIDHKASAKLRMFRDLQQQNQTGVGADIRSLVQAEDYTGMINLVEQYVNNGRGNQVSRFRKLISESLFNLANRAHRQIAISAITRSTVEEIAVIIEVLDLALRKLQGFLRELGHSLRRSLDNLNNQLTSTFANKLREMNSAAKCSNFVLLGRFKSDITELLHPTIVRCIAKDVMENKTKAFSKFDDALTSVMQSVDDFVASGLQKGSLLLKKLNNLQEARDCQTPRLDELAAHYSNAVVLLTREINDFHTRILSTVEEHHCFDEAISWMDCLIHQLNSGLRNHIVSSILQFDPTRQRDEWLSMKIQQDNYLEYEGSTAETKLNAWADRLERLHPQWWTGVIGFGRDKSYNRLGDKLQRKVIRFFEDGKNALKTRTNLAVARASFDQLRLIEIKVGKHIADSSAKRQNLERLARETFLLLCHEAQDTLRDGDVHNFDPLFPVYLDFVRKLPWIAGSDAGKASMTKVHELVFSKARDKISYLEKLFMNSTDFREIKEQVELVRTKICFFVERFVLLSEEIKRDDCLVVDTWLKKINSLWFDHFSCGREPTRVQDCFFLGLFPSASLAEIEATQQRLIECAAESRCVPGNSSYFNAAKLGDKEEAGTRLLRAEYRRCSRRCEPFDSQVRGVGTRLREQAQEYLRDQRYDLIDDLLFKLHDLRLLDDLVEPLYESRSTYDAVVRLVKEYVDGVRVDVETNWAEHKYKALNDSIIDLKKIETSLKSHADIFPTSWTTGILSKIESGIESLGDCLHQVLAKYPNGNQKVIGFRRNLVRLGSVMDDLQHFRELTKLTMSTSLESCLQYGWGPSFLFELGLSLQRGDQDASDDENRICHMNLGEFSHFREVITMVWNEETCQKPCEDTVRQIQVKPCTENMAANFSVDSNELLSNFFAVEETFKNFLATFLPHDADTSGLVEIVTRMSNELKPVNCIGGWRPEVKKKIPMILAGVFAVFTVLKSGTSYNRIEDERLGNKILMKPHNIQVFTLLCMLGCGEPTSFSLESQAMQVRTGEGKSLILGATATVLALLGYRVRCVCYSDYLSTRDYELFKDLFAIFKLLDRINYSKITTFSEETISAKGDIRRMTESMLRGELVQTGRRREQPEEEEILLVDELDVFFGSDFYGQTYNQGAKLRDTEVTEILQYIWVEHKSVGGQLRLSDVKATGPYRNLIRKYPRFTDIIDNEIVLMMSQVKKVNDEPRYRLDPISNRIGYKIMDTYEYDVTYGYCTMFAYLQEADKGKLRDVDLTLAQVLSMTISCGQFSYANISPKRILGVSGTIAAMGLYEREVLAKYGIDRFVYIPSVYGESNFKFDEVGDGISFETSTSDFYHSITASTLQVTRQNRATIVFFRNLVCLKDYKSSPFFKKLGRHVLLLSEEMDKSDKDFAVKKAATAGQITLCTAVFGRGTDFFCKDDIVQRNGGVHIIQTFLSEELSEEIQIQGRTARQGKKGSYEMVLLESDLCQNFRIAMGEAGRIPREYRYDWLLAVRRAKRVSHYQELESQLQDATEKDENTYKYFNALLAGDMELACSAFNEMYYRMKNAEIGTCPTIDLAFLVDVTGSMGPYAPAVASTIHTLVDQHGALMGKLKTNFPDTEFTIDELPSWDSVIFVTGTNSLKRFVGPFETSISLKTQRKQFDMLKISAM